MPRHELHFLFCVKLFFIHPTLYVQKEKVIMAILSKLFTLICFMLVNKYVTSSAVVGGVS